MLLDKKSGVTSFDSMGELKKAFATKKAGHTGTLDKFASGLLLVLVGHAVKLNFLFEGLPKEYYATVFFGEETDTLDPEGEVIAAAELPSRENVEAALKNFRGEIMQAPPAYSALHINGRRAHELAREGKAPEMKKRPVTIYDLEILSWNPPLLDLYAKVSAGTYIRSLARDIALAAGSRARLSALKRTKIGPFALDKAAGSNFEKTLRPIDPELFGELSLPCFFLDEKAEKDFIHGKPLEKLLPGASRATDEGPDEGASRVPGEGESAVEGGQSGCADYSAGVFGPAITGKNLPGRFLGVVSRKNGIWSYNCVFTDN